MFLRRYTTFLSALDIIVRRKLVLQSPDTWVDRNDTAFIGAYCERQNLSTVSALCLAQAPETFHHWQIFAGREAGVCIVFKGDEFKLWATKQPSLIARNVEYKAITELRSGGQIKTDDLPFLKRAGFEDEQEYRLISTAVLKRGETSTELDIDLSLIDRLTFSPFIHKSLFESAKAVVKGIEGCKNLRCSHSQLISNKQWIDLAINKPRTQKRKS